MSNNEKYKAVFREVFNVDDSQLNAAFTFQDVASWDSITHLTLISELEDTFDILFETDDILHFGGFINGKSILERYGIIFE